MVGRKATDGRSAFLMQIHRDASRDMWMMIKPPPPAVGKVGGKQHGSFCFEKFFALASNVCTGAFDGFYFAGNRWICAADWKRQMGSLATAGYERKRKLPILLMKTTKKKVNHAILLLLVWLQERKSTLSSRLKCNFLKWLFFLFFRQAKKAGPPLHMVFNVDKNEKYTWLVQFFSFWWHQSQDKSKGSTFTRLLTSDQPDGLMDKIPTFLCKPPVELQKDM